MKTTRFSDEQIIGLLKKAETGMAIQDLGRSGGFSQPTFYKWRAKSENTKLKKLLTEAHLGIFTRLRASLV